MPPFVLTRWKISGKFLSEASGFWPLSQAAKTPPFHGGSRSSILLGVTTSIDCKALKGSISLILGVFNWCYFRRIQQFVIYIMLEMWNNRLVNLLCSTSGLSHRPFTAESRVQIPYRVPYPKKGGFCLWLYQWSPPWRIVQSADWVPGHELKLPFICLSSPVDKSDRFIPGRSLVWVQP